VNRLLTVERSEARNVGADLVVRLRELVRPDFLTVPQLSKLGGGKEAVC